VSAAPYSVRAPHPVVETLAVVGVGLIGSSIIHAARHYGLARRVIAYDADAPVRARVRETRMADEVVDALDGVAAADLVILCVPMGAMEPVLAALGPLLREGTIVSDVGSVKGAVLAAAIAHLPAGVAMVPAHPVAGTEESGPDAGFATLFEGRWSILTPAPETPAAAVASVQALWQGMGARVEIMSAAHHDLVLAITSHVPHLIAYNIVGTAADLEQVTQSEVIKFSAGGFRDFTRIASSDPTMWRDIFLTNKEAVLEMLGRFTEDLIAVQRLVRDSDGQGLFDLFTRTRAIRRGIIAQGQETPAPDFGRRGKTPA
jgi:cyclohexadieny/prephenate dehydrogenase